MANKSERRLQRARDALLARRDIALRLRRKLESAVSTKLIVQVETPPAKPIQEYSAGMRAHFLEQARNPPIPKPPFRRLRVYAYDPGQQTQPDSFDVSIATLFVRWEDELQAGPIGEYLEVIDVDPASGCCYAPVDLNNPLLLAEQGLTPSEANPQFHQQMVYAVAMTTIAHFERALGRRALWAARTVRDGTGRATERRFEPKLRIYPHALREANAYYNPEKLALLFGYFQASNDDGSVVEGTEIFAATSHDIIAHETTHALLDGLHPRYSEPSNSDMAAFHEAFSDIVALFQHFTMPESLLRDVRTARGALNLATNLGVLARQFGQATGMHGALRRFVGQTGSSIVKLSPDISEPHTRGAVLVSAVFAAFLTIYRARSADLVRLATNGSGILPAGEISYDLAGRLAAEAAKVAEHVLGMCIRALDYCPPVNLEFGDYIRAIITADRDHVPYDKHGYRVAFIDAFRERGITPSGLHHLGEDSLVWEPPAIKDEPPRRFPELVPQLNLEWALNVDRESAFRLSQENAKVTHRWLSLPKNADLRDALGLRDPEKTATLTIEDGELAGELRNFEVHAVRPARHNSPDGTTKANLVIELTQTFRANPDGERYRGGCTLIIDLNNNSLKYVIRKRLFGLGLAQRQIDSRNAAIASAADNNQLYFAPTDPARRANAFAMLHRCGREV
jgi:hypothetical protein